jgi:hypothetical protein
MPVEELEIVSPTAVQSGGPDRASGNEKEDHKDKEKP